MALRSSQDSAQEETWVAKSRRNDPQAFGKIVDAYQNRVYGFVRRMLGSDEEAQDVTQEVFIKAFQSIGRFDGRSSLRTWLFRIAYNLCIDRSRRAARRVSETSMEPASAEDEPQDFPDSRWDPASVVINDELLRVVEAAIETMSDKLRSVLLLHDREEMDYDQIARTIDVPVGTVKSRLFLARAHIQRQVTEYLGEGQR